MILYYLSLHTLFVVMDYDEVLEEEGYDMVDIQVKHNFLPIVIQEPELPLAVIMILLVVHYSGEIRLHLRFSVQLLLLFMS